MIGYPLLNRRMLVGAIVVADQMKLTRRITAGERIEKGNELAMAMAAKAPRMDLAAGYLQRSKQAGGAMAGVIVGAARGQARPHRQQRLGAIKRLNLRLFIHAQHQRPLGRVQIEPNNVGQLAVEVGVGAELEGLDPMRLQTVLAPCDARWPATSRPPWPAAARSNG